MWLSKLLQGICKAKYFPWKSSYKYGFILLQVQTQPRVKVLSEFPSPESGEGIWPLKKLEVKCHFSRWNIVSLTVIWHRTRVEQAVAVGRGPQWPSNAWEQARNQRLPSCPSNLRKIFPLIFEWIPLFLLRMHGNRRLWSQEFKVIKNMSMILCI